MDEIADELENILQRSCISLKAVQDNDLGNSRSHENVLSQGKFQSTSRISNDCLENPGKSGPFDNIELLTPNVTENHLTFRTNHTLCKSAFPHSSSSQSNLQLGQPCIFSVPNDPSVEHAFSTSKETDEDKTEDEFDCCFDGLTLNKERPRNLIRSFSTAGSSLPYDDNVAETLTEKKPSVLFKERKCRNGGLGLNETFGLLKFTGTFNKCRNVGQWLNLKQDNSKVKSGGHHSDLNKNSSDVLGVSEKVPIHRDIVKEVFSTKANLNKTNVKNVILSSRHLTNQATLGSFPQSKTKNYKTESANIKRVMDQDRDKVGKNINSFASESNASENYENKVKQGSFKNNYQPFKYESRSADVAASCRETDEDWLKFLGCSLAHGKESEMTLALEILKRQFPFSEMVHNEFSFHSDLISVQTIVGPPVYNSCVLEGTVVELSKENQSTVVCDSNTPKKIALVKGDINYHYRHLGFKDSIKVTRTLDKDDFCNPNSQSEWISRVIQLVKNLNLGIVATLGHVTSELRDHMQASGVIVLENLSNRQLDVLSKMTGAPIISYILDITVHDLGKPVLVRIWDSGWSSSKHSSKSHAVQTLRFGQICVWSDKVLKLNSVVYSVVLCGPVEDLVNDSELKFWNCVCRLRNAFENQCVLPGGGDIERICLKHLADIRGKSNVL